MTEQIRPLSFEPHYLAHADGSVLVKLGHTHVLCTASISEGVPRFLKHTQQGWLTAEYGMLPGSTHTRTDREAVRGRQSGRTLEIQRLIGRSLRSAINLKKLGGYTITIDCDVIQADGGTRTAAISGACIAMIHAIQTLQYRQLIKTDPIRYLVAGISVGMVKGSPQLDLDYALDASADTDMNVVMNDRGEFIEIQGTAERTPFSHTQLHTMLTLAESGISKIIEAQRIAIQTQPNRIDT